MQPFGVQSLLSVANVQTRNHRIREGAMTNRKLNHKLWKIIYLLAIWAGLELGITLQAHSEVVHRVPQAKPVVEYRWKALDYYIHLLKMRELLYGRKREKNSF
jgi:hypothetical protein